MAWYRQQVNRLGPWVFLSNLHMIRYPRHSGGSSLHLLRSLVCHLLGLSSFTIRLPVPSVPTIPRVSEAALRKSGDLRWMQPMAPCDKYPYHSRQ